MIKKLLSSVREYKRESILAPVYVIAEVVLEVLIPFIMASLIDKGIDAGSMSAIWKYGVILLVCAMASLFFGMMAGKEAAVASSGLAKNLRKDMYYKVQNYSFSNIDKFSTASIVTRLTTDVTNVQNAFQMVIRMAVRCPIMLIFALIVAFRINVRLSMVFVVILPILAVVLFLLISRVHPYFIRIFKTYDKLNGVVQENLNGIRVVKSYIREEHETDKFGKISNMIYKDFVKAEKMLTMNMPAMMLAIYACIILISWLGAKAIVLSGNMAGVPGGLTTGELMSMFTYAMQILMSLMMIAMILVMLVMARSSAERIVEILDEESDIRNRENPVMDVPDGSILFEKVQFAYSKNAGKNVLSDINLNIKAG